MRILAIDPGRAKCGLAVGESRQLIKSAVVSSTEAVETIRAWVNQYSPQRVLIGNRTGARWLQQRLSTELREVPIVLVEEGGTTLEARRRYFQDHPPRGWRRLVPISMQRPPEPYDDYVAAILLERHIAG